MENIIKLKKPHKEKWIMEIDAADHAGIMGKAELVTGQIELLKWAVMGMVAEQGEDNNGQLAALRDAISNLEDKFGDLQNSIEDLRVEDPPNIKKVRG